MRGLALGIVCGALLCRVVAVSVSLLRVAGALAGLCGRLLVPPLGAVLSLLRWRWCVLWGAFGAVPACQLMVAYRCSFCFLVVSVAWLVACLGGPLVLSVGVLCGSLVVRLGWRRWAFEEVFRPLLVLPVVAEVGFCVSLVAAAR